MPTLAGVSPDTESKLKAKPAIQSWQKNIAQQKKEEDEKEIARKAKRALYARERRARIKREREEEEAAKNKNDIGTTQDVGSDVIGEPPPKKKKKKVSIPPPKTQEDTKKKQQQVSVEQAVGHQGQFVKVRLKLPTGTQKFGFSLRDDVQSYGLPVLSSLLPDSPYINSIPPNLINNYWITKLRSSGMKDDVNIYSSKMLVEELGKIRSSSAVAASGNKKDDETSWVDITFTVRSPLLLSFIQKAVATEKKKEEAAAAASSPTKKKSTTPAQEKKVSPKKKSTVPKEKGATKKKSPNSITTKKSPSATTNVTVDSERNNLDPTSAVDTIKAAARFRVAQAELALEFASAQLRSAMNELEDARAEFNRAENWSIIGASPQQQHGKGTGEVSPAVASAASAARASTERANNGSLVASSTTGKITTNGQLLQTIEENNKKEAILSPQLRRPVDLWNEYEYGLDGKKPAKLFTKHEKNRDTSTKRRYYRRKQIWDVMARQIAKGLSPEQAEVELYEVYGANTSVTAMSDMIVNDRKKYGDVHPNLTV